MLADLKAIAQIREKDLSWVFSEALWIYLKLTREEMKGGKILYKTKDGKLFEVVKK